MLAGFFYYRFDLAVYAVIFSYVVYNISIIIIHEHWAHNQLVPRNDFCRFLINLFGYASIFPFSYKVSPLFFWKVIHISHHINFKSSHDYVQNKLNRLHWLPYLFCSDLGQKSDNKKAKELYQSSNEEFLTGCYNYEKFIDRNYQWIITLLHIAMLMTLGFKYYFYFVFFPTWISIRLILLFGEIVPHRHKKTKEEEYDSPWLFPLIGTQAYHVSHHRYPYDLNVGPGNLKYFNIQHYFILLFYQISKDIKVR